MGMQQAWLTSLRRVNRATRERDAVRRFAISAYSEVVRINRFFPPPRVLLNGPGKSGTHLASDCLSLLPKMAFSGRHFSVPLESTLSGRADERLFAERPQSSELIDEEKLQRYLAACTNGMFVTAHAPYHPRLAQMLTDLDYKQILFLRDPRDVAVSFLRFVTTLTSHHQYEYFSANFDDDAERLMAIIEGFDDTENGEYRPTIAQQFGSYLTWADDPNVLVCRFEDLVGSRGGGDSTSQADTIAKIAAFLDRDLSDSQIEDIAGRVFSTASYTFRKGAIGDWTNHFDAAHRQAFSQVSDDLLERLGYAGMSDW